MIRNLPAMDETGVLLSRYSEVHRPVGGHTKCGRPAPKGRVASVTQLQAFFYELPLCGGCYPDPHTHRRPHTAGGGRP